MRLLRDVNELVQRCMRGCMRGFFDGARIDVTTLSG
jgi:hypothetical protein